MDKKLEQISSSVSSLENKFESLESIPPPPPPPQLEANQSETRATVKEREEDLNELHKQEQAR